MNTRLLGQTGIRVSPVALGCGALGDARWGEREAVRLVLGALELGINLFDSARSYGLSEERLGRFLRGHEVVRSTKGGYGIDGVADWSAEAIEHGIDEALRRMQTGCIDLFHLHSCPLEVLRREDVLGALDRAREAGKIRVACYSGDNAELDWAVRSGRFGAVQASVSLYDQQNLAALSGGVGVLAKRPLANGTWRAVEPHDDASRAYRDRHQRLAFEPSEPWDGYAARFTAYAPGVTSILAGTTSLEHLRRVVEAVERGPLAPDATAEIHQRFAATSRGEWRAMT
jgi:aryl-alcohol dehydrogenase-like predicted oxidoreductase